VLLKRYSRAEIREDTKFLSIVVFPEAFCVVSFENVQPLTYFFS
jgi:hypothetical protein